MSNGESYRHTQIGWPMLVILPIVVIIPAVLLAGTETCWAVGVLGTVSIVVAALLGTLTVVIDPAGLHIRFGIGLIRKTFTLFDIRDCGIVRSPWYHGTGIRMIQGGWLYTVSGSLAVELDLSNGRRVRIGTNEPERLIAAVRNAIPELRERAARDAVPDAGFPWQLLIPVPLVAVVAVMLYAQVQSPTVEIAAGTLRVSSLFYSSTIPVAEITEVIVADSLPAIAARTNGFALGGALRGRFRLTAFGSGTLYVNRRHPPFVIVRTRDSFVIVGFSDPAQTQRLVADLARAGRS